MDHVVYVDHKEGDLQKLRTGQKRMVIRGAAGRKLPYDRVHAGEWLYFIENNGTGLVEARAQVQNVIQAGPLSAEESAQVIHQHNDALQLTGAQGKRWVGKRFLVLIAVGPVESVAPFAIDRSAYGNMDDWLPVGEIERVRLA